MNRQGEERPVSSSEGRSPADAVEPTAVEPTDVEPTDVGPTDVEPTGAGPTGAGPTDTGPAQAAPTDAPPAPTPERIAQRVAALDMMGDLPLSEHVELYQRLHSQLQSALAEIDNP